MRQAYSPTVQGAACPCSVTRASSSALEMVWEIRMKGGKGERVVSINDLVGIYSIGLSEM